MKTRVLLGFVLLGSLVACSSASPPAEQDVAVVTDDDSVVIAASDAARDELGVVSWRSKVANGGSTVRGMDDAGSAIVELVSKKVTSSAGVQIQQSLVNGAEKGTLVISATRAKDGNMAFSIGSTFKGKLARVAEIIALDVEAGAKDGTSLSLKKQSIRPRVTLAESCDGALTCAQSGLSCAGSSASLTIVCPKDGVGVLIGAGGEVLNGDNPVDAVDEQFQGCIDRFKEATWKCDQFSARCGRFCTAGSYSRECSDRCIMEGDGSQHDNCINNCAEDS